MSGAFLDINPHHNCLKPTHRKDIIVILIIVTENFNTGNVFILLLFQCTKKLCNFFSTIMKYPRSALEGLHRYVMKTHAGLHYLYSQLTERNIFFPPTLIETCMICNQCKCSVYKMSIQIIIKSQQTNIYAVVYFF